MSEDYGGWTFPEVIGDALIDNLRFILINIFSQGVWEKCAELLMNEGVKGQPAPGCSFRLV